MMPLAPEILDPVPYCTPSFHMSPYQSADLERLVVMGGSTVEPEWPELTGLAGYHFTLTAYGREAISAALVDLRLAGEDEVLIVTTSQSSYVSACVTQAIEAVARPSRKPSTNTRAILLIHEFGFPAKLPTEAQQLAAQGVPVIEDCAYAMGSGDADGPVGRLGDYVVFSFSKAFCVPFGGLLASRRPLRGRHTWRSRISESGAALLRAEAAARVMDVSEDRRRRRDLYARYVERLAPAGLLPRFDASHPKIIPHAFVFALAREAAVALKPRLNAKGIESSVFYGGGGYFVPNHQALDDAGVDYIAHNITLELSRVGELE